MSFTRWIDAIIALPPAVFALLWASLLFFAALPFVLVFCAFLPHEKRKAVGLWLGARVKAASLNKGE